MSCRLCDCFCGFPTDFTPLPHFRHHFKEKEPQKWTHGNSEDLQMCAEAIWQSHLSYSWEALSAFFFFFSFFLRNDCLLLVMPEATHICLDFDELTPRQIQDIYSGMPRGHTVGGDVVAVRVASFALPPPPRVMTLPLSSLPLAFFCWKRRGWISNPIPAQFMNVTVTCWTALTSAEVKAHEQTEADSSGSAPARERAFTEATRGDKLNI